MSLSVLIYWNINMYEVTKYSSDVLATSRRHHQQGMDMNMNTKTWIKTKWKKKKSFKCKNEAVGNTRLLPHVNMLLVPMIFLSLAGRLHLWRKTFWLRINVIFAANSYWEVMTLILIFCGHCFRSAWFALWCKRISFDLFWNAKLFIAAK